MQRHSRSSPVKLYDIGREIRKLRRDSGITQEELGQKCGISRITLGRLERGEIASISLKTLDAILHALHFEICFAPERIVNLPTLDEIKQEF